MFRRNDIVFWKASRPRVALTILFLLGLLLYAPASPGEEDATPGLTASAWPDSGTGAPTPDTFRGLALAFEPNRGQTDPQEPPPLLGIPVERHLPVGRPGHGGYTCNLRHPVGHHPAQ